MKAPLFSIMIPNFNGPQFLLRAVESALTRQGADPEVIAALLDRHITLRLVVSK